MPSSGKSKTQSAAILRLLVDAKGEWVPLPKIMECAAQYNARIFELRRDGFTIENRTEVIDEVKHSWFRIVHAPAAQPPNSPETPKPEPEWKDRPRLTGLPLFDLVARR